MATLISDLIKTRRSIRKYLDKKVERKKIQLCVEAARLAPSADNVQPWRFIIIDEPELKNQLAKQAFSGIYSPSKFAAKAPVIIVILAKLNLIAHGIGRQIQGIHYYFIDIGIAGEHLVLQALELGLGTCWIGWFNPRKIRKLLNIPKNYKIASLMSLGYPEQKKSIVKKRKRLENIAWFNGFKKRNFIVKPD